MKKFLPILYLFAVAVLPAYSAITPEEAISEAYIYQHGHSDEMARLIDLQSSQINGTPTKFKGQNLQWYDEQPYKSVKKIVAHFDKTPENNIFLQDNLNDAQPFKFVRQLFTYWDKGLDDGKFGQNDLHYTNKYDDL